MDKGCRAYPSFPLINLPTDVQLLILRNMDLHTIQKLIIAIPSTKELYLSYPSSVLRAALANMGVQTRNLLLTTYSLFCAIKFEEIYPKPDLSNMTKSLVEHLDVEELANIEIFECDTIGALYTLCEIDAEIEGLVTDYAKDVYEAACQRHNVEAIVPPLVLSSVETHRITRAFHRMKLFGMLFFDYTHCFDLEIESSYTIYLDRFSTFELDELITAYNWLYTKRRHFKPAFVHKNCSSLRIGSWRNGETSDCEYCRRACAGPGNQSGSVTRPETQSLWSMLMEKNYISEYELWALPESTRRSPLKIWHDQSETNEPNDGWLLWSKVRDNTEGRIDEKEHLEHFRALGYCFWDSARLEGWGRMFREDWFGEERGKTTCFAWCDCCGPCDW
jgi:hypothetical protein